MVFVPTRVLIFGKTYPELSTRHTETVCTGGMLENGRPIRLYPVPLRYLEGEQRYQLYQWGTFSIERSTSDPRPESHRIDPQRIALADVVDTDDGTWRRRREMVNRDTSWHFGGMAELHEAQRSRGCSIGMVTPGTIDDVQVIDKLPGEREAHERKARALQLQAEADFFLPEYKDLAFLPKEIHLKWRCADRCVTCRRQPHDMKVLDWGLLELARRVGWEAARSRLATITDAREHEFSLFLGTFRLHPQNFGIIGLWYPKRRDQLALL